ncbi:MAG: hypothetical protein WCG29_10230 [Desulfomonile sp.]|nr:hypothetical protein [Deltaproteobacteria bacterium]
MKPVKVILAVAIIVACFSVSTGFAAPACCDPASAGYFPGSNPW